MKIKCEYCGSYISDTDEKCSNCGAVNKQLKRNSDKTPQTIEELKQWYVDHNLPDENVTRFFIGKDYKAPKAFGIYKDEATGNFVVYKNKDTGVRAIRYEGKDEAYAVNELYLKLKEEILNQKRANINKSKVVVKNGPKDEIKSALLIMLLTFGLPFVIAIIGLIVSAFTPSRGYYKYNNYYYYYQSGSWYTYDDGWSKTTPPEDLKENYSDYYNSSTYSYGYDIDRFEDSSYYHEPSSDSDWDSGSSWDSSDSWDSGSTDWGSDW